MIAFDIFGAVVICLVALVFLVVIGVLVLAAMGKLPAGAGSRRSYDGTGSDAGTSHSSWWSSSGGSSSSSCDSGWSDSGGGCDGGGGGGGGD